MTELAPLKTPEKAAPFCGYSARTLRDMAGAGKIPCSRPGNKIMFSDADIAEIQAMIRRPAQKTTALVVRGRRAA